MPRIFLYWGMVPIRCLVKSIAVLGLLAASSPAEPYETALARYRRWVKRPTLRKRNHARQLLANTEDERALAVLIKDYARPEKPKDQVRYLIAFMLTDAFAGPPAVASFERWRAQHKKPIDAWMWYRTFVAHHEEKGAGDLMAIARSPGPVFQRAAAIEGLRARFDPKLLELVPEVLKRLPSKPTERAVLLESLAAGIAGLKDERAKPEFKAPAIALFEQMDRPTTTMRTKIVMGRYFARLFGTRFVWRTGSRWRTELEFFQRGGKAASQRGYAKKKPNFAGIEANGDRIAYVIDMSDSMLTPLSPRELEKLPNGPVTGRPGPKKKSKNDAWEKAFENVNWKNVKNRFDAARELLKTSLLGLDDDKHFAVFWFGDKAGLLKSTAGMTKVSAASVKRTMQELDAIRPGPKKDNRPHGTLRGTTNMHGALHRAFKLRGKGMVGAGEYVNLKTWNGCDVIFVLSDGDPSWDDWAGLDARDKLDRVGDPEMGGGGNQDATQLNFPGPYARGFYLSSDVRRLNLFRKVEIHCVGMGEANMSLMQRLAAIGLGKAISLRGK